MEPHFNQTSIIGVGIMGSSLALAFKKYNLSKKIVGVSSDRTIKKALELKIINEGFTYADIDKGVKGSSLIILCSPINVIIEHIKILSNKADEGAVITDVGSTKVKINETASRFLPRDIYFVGGHPMAGSEQSGVDSADPNIFVNRAYMLIPGSNTPDELTGKLKDIIITIGSVPYILDAETHDKIVAAVSHLPQMLSVALINTVGSFDSDSDDYFRLTGGGFYDMTRIASSPFKIWKDICETNTHNIQNAISVYIEKLEEIKESIGNKKLERIFKESNQLREKYRNLKSNE